MNTDTKYKMSTGDASQSVLPSLYEQNHSFITHINSQKGHWRVQKQTIIGFPRNQGFRDLDVICVNDMLLHRVPWMAITRDC